jgi:hypothetical protein
LTLFSQRLYNSPGFSILISPVELLMKVVPARGVHVF